MAEENRITEQVCFSPSSSLTYNLFLHLYSRSDLSIWPLRQPLISILVSSASLFSDVSEPLTLSQNSHTLRCRCSLLHTQKYDEIESLSEKATASTSVSWEWVKFNDRKVSAFENNIPPPVGNGYVYLLQRSVTQ